MLLKECRTQPMRLEQCLTTDMSTSRRIGLWFVCVLVAATLFGLFITGFVHVEAAFMVLRVTLLFASPVALLYLPLVVWLRDAEQRRIWTIVASGVVIGPLTMLLLGLVSQLFSAVGSHQLWYGDGIDFGVLQSMIFALIVGFLTTAMYAAALKIFARG